MKYQQNIALVHVVVSKLEYRTSLSRKLVAGLKLVDKAYNIKE